MPRRAGIQAMSVPRRPSHRAVVQILMGLDLEVSRVQISMSDFDRKLSRDVQELSRACPRLVGAGETPSRFEARKRRVPERSSLASNSKRRRRPDGGGGQL